MLAKLINLIAPNETVRYRWIENALSQLEIGGKILDAGCGTQRYKKHCEHLDYYGQDFGEYVADENSVGLQNTSWDYGELKYTGDCWNIDEQDKFFDNIICTEVLEHIPYPNEAIQEFSRLMKPGGTLILTAPYACLPHMQPYFFYSGFSKEWYKEILTKNSFEILEISPNGNFFRYLIQENIRGVKLIKSIPFKIIYSIFIIPKVVLDFLVSKISKNDQLVFGYHILAKKTGRK